MKKKIYYHDTDSGGVVYYANYLKYIEEARTEFFAQRGISLKELMHRSVFFVVARQKIDYKSPAFYADTLDISCSISEITNVKIIFEHEIKNQQGKLVAQAQTTLVFVNKDFKPAIMPDEITNKLKAKIMKG